MTYKNVAFLLPLLVTSISGGQHGDWKAPQNGLSSSSWTSLLPPGPVVTCVVDPVCGDFASSLTIMIPTTGNVRLKLVVEGKLHTMQKPRSDVSSAEFVVMCDGQQLKLSFQPSGCTWSAIQSCSDVEAL